MNQWRYFVNNVMKLRTRWYEISWKE